MIKKLAQLYRTLDAWFRRCRYAQIPTDSSGRPDLKYYTASASFYHSLLCVAHKQVNDTSLSAKARQNAYSDRVHATWGLIAKGAQALPIALELLNNANEELRADASSILAEISKDEKILDALASAFATSTTTEARDSILAAIGSFKSDRAAVILAHIIRSGSLDEDQKFDAIQFLGSLAATNFHAEEKPTEAALAFADSKAWRM